MPLKNLLAALAAMLSVAPVCASTLPFINELHYDNTGADTGEGVEIAAAAGFAVDAWTLEFYNGSTGSPYDTLALSGTISDQQGGFGTLFFATGSLQNGAPDGVALVDGGGVVQQFLSYEGSFVATAGAAAGMASTDIGVAEPADTPAGWSLQLSGTGHRYQHFAWAAAGPSSYGAVNPDQQFAPVPAPATVLLLVSAIATLAARGAPLQSLRGQRAGGALPADRREIL